jgi:hypothetical protein
MAGVRFIAGSGRSGTTWVQDSLATANGLRPVFEPLHPYVSEIGRHYAHRALGPEDEHSDLEAFLNDVCAGRRNRLWTKYRRQLRWLLPPPREFSTLEDAGRVYRSWRKFVRELPRLAMAARRSEPLVKCIRANLMLGWLSRKWGSKTVLIVRHPGAVIESELREHWNAHFALERFRRDTRLHELTQDRYRSLLQRQMTPVEALAARWVVENQWIVEKAAENEITVVFYEWLKSRPDLEWERVRVALNLERVPPREVLKRPSQQSSPKRSTAVVSEPDAPRWLRVLSREQQQVIQRILDDVGIDFYTMSDPDPRISTRSDARKVPIEVTP